MNLFWTRRRGTVWVKALQVWSVCAAALYLALAFVFGTIVLVVEADDGDTAAIVGWLLFAGLTVIAGALMLTAAVKALPRAAGVPGFAMALALAFLSGSSGILLFPFALMNAPALLLIFRSR
jgi:cytochrome bd-type quinol oxidase subunit 2